MAKRVTVRTITIGQAMGGTTYLPTDGLDVSAYEEGVLAIKLDVTDGTFTAVVQSYDTIADWHDIKDMFGQATTKVFTIGPSNDQLHNWQLRNFGKAIRVKFTAVGATQAANVNQLIWIGKS